MAKFTAVGNRIYRLNLPYKDIYTTVVVLESDKGNILFDTAFTQADVQEQILPAYKALGLADPKYIFISHNHGDHAGGLKWVLEAFPEATVLSRSAALAQSHPGAAFISPEDGDLFLEDFQVVTVPGHTPDCSAILDRRSGTLVTGDCLQVYGIYGSGAWGAVICWQQQHLEALKKLHTMDIRAIIAAHDYHPYGNSVRGKAEVKAYLDGCLEALCRIRDILKVNPDRTDEEVTALCNDGKLPTVPVKVVTNLRALLETGGI